LPLNALLVAVAGAACWAVNARPRWFFASSLAATAITYGLSAWAFAATTLREWDRLKHEYPMESLAGRLAYEDRPRTAPHLFAEAGRLGPAAETSPRPERLDGLEARITREENQPRVLTLRHLHSGVVEQFIAAPGFGVMRTVRAPSPFYLDLERAVKGMPTPSDPQPASPYLSRDGIPGPVKAATGSELLDGHDGNTVAFLDPARFGYPRDREHVAGFRPHGFGDGPQAPPRWLVARLDLVSLLKFDEPAVYLSPNFPRMGELRQAPTRPLDGFEKEALAGLRRGEDLMAQEVGQGLRLLGSVRAVTQCVRCHRVERGELLGAFSYKLSRE
jgi:hypothetical protein